MDFFLKTLYSKYYEERIRTSLIPSFSIETYNILRLRNIEEYFGTNPNDIMKGLCEYAHLKYIFKYLCYVDSTDVLAGRFFKLYTYMCRRLKNIPLSSQQSFLKYSDQLISDCKFDPCLTLSILNNVRYITPGYGCWLLTLTEQNNQIIVGMCNLVSSIEKDANVFMVNLLALNRDAENMIVERTRVKDQMKFEVISNFDDPVFRGNTSRKGCFSLSAPSVAFAYTSPDMQNYLWVIDHMTLENKWYFQLISCYLYIYCFGYIYRINLVTGNILKLKSVPGLFCQFMPYSNVSIFKNFFYILYF